SSFTSLPSLSSSPSLHDALPISAITSFSGFHALPIILEGLSMITPVFIFLYLIFYPSNASTRATSSSHCASVGKPSAPSAPSARSEEHTSELQSRFDLVCRLLLE